MNFITQKSIRMCLKAITWRLPDVKLMPSVAQCIRCVLLCVVLIGCGKSHDSPVRFGVQGSIRLDEQPLDAGRIRFIPQEPASGPAASGTITNGTYEIPAGEGVVVGKHRVEIEAAIDAGFPIDDDVAFANAAKIRGANVLPRNPIPERYNRRSELSVEVTPDGERNFDFELSSAGEPR